VTSVSPSAFEQVFSYLYTGKTKIHLFSEKELLDLILFSHELSFDAFKATCMNSLLPKINIENVVSLLEKAHLLGTYSISRKHF
jgi:hypothetical protein